MTDEQPNKTSEAEIPESTPAGFRPCRYFLVGLLIAGALWSCCWFVVAARTRTALEVWVRKTRDKGYGVGFQGYRVGGFPTSLTIAVDRPSLAAPNEGGPVVWRGDKLILGVKPWNPNHVFADASGPNRFGYQDGEAMRVFGGVVDRLTGDIQFVDGRLEAMNIVSEGLRLAESNQVGDVRIASLRLLVVQDPAGRGGTVEMRIKDLTAGGFVKLPLGPTVSAISGRFELAKAGPERFDKRHLSAWRDGGGTIKVDRLRLNYGPLDLRATGVLALDADLQPVSSLISKTKGFFAFVDALAARGLIKSSRVPVAKLVLGAMAGASGGETGILKLPINVKDRRLFVGPVELLRFHRIRWPKLSQ